MIGFGLNSFQPKVDNVYNLKLFPVGGNLDANEGLKAMLLGKILLFVSSRKKALPASKNIFSFK